jgi:hypothetical protein
MKTCTIVTLTLISALGLALLGPTPNAAAQPLTADEIEKLGHRVHFAFDKSDLDAETRARLDEVATWAKDNPDQHLVVIGHTDHVGSRAYNRELGERRARAVRRYLIARGVDADRIEIRSRGERQAIYGQDWKNRRAVFLVERPGAETTGEVAGDAIGDQPPAPSPHARTTGPIFEGPDDKADDTALLTPAGLSISLGGGVIDYFDDETRDATSVGGLWEVRLTYGTRSVLAIEAAYVGFAQSIDALGLDGDAALLGSMAETNLRVNVPVLRVVQPYIFGGIGLTHIDLVNESFNTSNIAGDETALHFPIGAGVGLRASGAMIDLRATARPTVEDELIDPAAVTDEDDLARLHSWSATARVGWEF